MPTVIPFRAVRPAADKAGLTTSRPYPSYSPEERAALLAENPYSFIHIIEEKGLPQIRRRYLDFKKEGIFIQDRRPGYYLYSITTPQNRTFTGIIAAVSVRDYENNIIKQHENTLQKREILFKDYLKAVGFNAEPVLMTYPDSPVLENTVGAILQTGPEYEFTTSSGDIHSLWLVGDDKAITQIRSAFAQVPALYIADGHHRSASSVRLCRELQGKTPFDFSLFRVYRGAQGDMERAPFHYYMSYLIPESQLKISSFNRLVKDLNGLGKDEFIAALDNCFEVEKKGETAYVPTLPHNFSLYIDGEYYALRLRKDKHLIENPLGKLDAQILYKTVLKPILGIGDLRNDDRIDYLYDQNGMTGTKKAVDSGVFRLGFGLLPVTTAQLKKIADAQLTMPPKTTYVEPKMRSGLTVYECL